MAESLSNNIGYFHEDLIHFKNIDKNGERKNELQRGSSNDTISTAFYNSDEEEFTRKEEKHSKAEKSCINRNISILNDSVENYVNETKIANEEVFTPLSFKVKLGDDEEKEKEKEANEDEVYGIASSSTPSIEINSCVTSQNGANLSELYVHPISSYTAAYTRTAPFLLHPKMMQNNYNHQTMHTFHNRLAATSSVHANNLSVANNVVSQNLVPWQLPRIKIDAPEIFPAMIRKNVGKDSQIPLPETIVSYNGRWRLVLPSVPPCSTSTVESVTSLHNNTQQQNICSNINKNISYLSDSSSSCLNANMLNTNTNVYNNNYLHATTANAFSSAFFLGGPATYPLPITYSFHEEEQKNDVNKEIIKTNIFLKNKEQDEIHDKIKEKIDNKYFAGKNITKKSKAYDYIKKIFPFLLGDQL